MFRLVQVLLDGSSYAEHALPLAVGIARRDGATLHVVRVYVPIADIDLYKQGDLFANLDRELMEHAGNNLDAVVASIAETTGLLATAVQLKGPVVDMIARHASTSGADVLIMTPQGRGPLSRFWFGSVADSLVRQTSIPILVIRPQENAPDIAQPPSVRHLLIPLDGSALAEQALEPALTLGNADNSEFTLLRVVPRSLSDHDPISGRVKMGLGTSWHRQLHDLRRQLEAEAQDYLDQVAGRLRAQSLNVRTRLIAHEQTATAILDTASSPSVDAIALTTRGQGGLKRLLLGSVADKVIRGASMPVLICPPVDESKAFGDRAKSRG